jgi:LCP family protein required for cell wall assembly
MGQDVADSPSADRDPSAVESADPNADESTDERVDRSADESVHESADESVHESADESAGADPEPPDSGADQQPRRSLAHALVFTVASVFVWGVAHLAAGRRIVGLLLMVLFAVIIGGGVVVLLYERDELQQIAVQRDWLAGITIGILVLALVWAAVVVRSYQILRPKNLARLARVLAGTLVLVLVMGVCAPLVWAARDTYTLRDAIGSIFHGDEGQKPVIANANDPWKDKPRINVLLLGGDGAGDRVGIRTDSMTVASIDTHTGDTVLISLPRNLQHFPMIPRLQRRWPDGFTGVSAPGDQGLLNELYQDAEDDPSLVRGYSKGRRGPEMMRQEISYLIGQPIDYYIMINLFGFAKIVDAMGGVKVHIPQDIPFGGPEYGSAPAGVIKAGNRTLDGKTALWFGRSRTASSDFDRMGRQKCLMKDVAEQADPQKVLTRFEQLAKAAKKTLSTNIPAEMLPALVKLSGTMKHGADITSLMFVPPQYHVVRPDLRVMHRATVRAIAASEAKRANGGQEPSAQPSTSADPSTSAQPGKKPHPTASSGGRSKSRAVSLTAACG